MESRTPLVPPLWQLRLFTGNGGEEGLEGGLPIVTNALPCLSMGDVATGLCVVKLNPLKS